MNIRLTPYGEELVKAQLAHGPYHSPEEAIERALESLAAQRLERMTVDLAQFEAGLDALAEGSERLPILPPTVTSRAEIYRNHD